MRRYVSLNNADLVREPEVVQRRRIQNRNAQRRFREKKKAQRQTPTNEDERHFSLAQNLLPPCDELNPDLQWHLDDQDILAFLHRIPSPTERAIQQNRTLSVRPESTPSGDFTDDNLDVYKTISETDASFDLQALSPVDHVGSNMLDAEEPCSEPPVAHQQTYEGIPQSPIRPSTAAQNESRFELIEHASLMARKQRLHLCGQAEQLLQRVISIYDIGNSLDILTADAHLRHFIRSALDRFKLQRLDESIPCSEAGTRESRSASIS